jgi:hypothetical protein
MALRTFIRPMTSCADRCSLPDIRAVLALSPGGPGPSTAGSPIEVASPTIVETAGFFEMTEEEVRQRSD